MGNMNNIENEEMLAFAKDYAELCRKHGLYLVFNDDVWLQYAGNEQDLAEVEPNLVEILGEDRKIKPADQWTHEEQTKFTEENQPVIVFNRIGAFVNFAKGMEIKERNGTLDDSSRELLKKLEAVVDNHIQDVNVPSPVLIHKTNAVTRIICEEGIKEELKNGRVVEIGDGRELALDENGELDIVNTGMV